ncbi:MAG: hybrid sensor histidine kinase/response regulator [Pseudomonadota bacterium]
MFGSALIAAYVLRASTSSGLLGGWLLVLLLLICGQAVWARRRLRRLAGPIDAPYTGWILSLGATWALFYALTFATLTNDQQILILLLTGGVCVAHVGGHHTHPRVTVTFVLLLLVPLMLLSLSSRAWLQLSILMVAALVLARFTYILHRFVKTAALLREERQELLRELSVQAAALDEASAAKSRFLAQASHDLRQPLHAMGLFMEGVADLPEQGRAGQAVAQLRRSVETLSSLFDSLLDTSLLDAGQVTPKLSPVPVAQLFDDLRRDYAESAADSGVSLRIVHSSLWVHTDPALLRRLVQNLLANAIRFATRRVVVGIRRAGGSGPVLLVADDGPGIAKVDQERVFAEFVRLAQKQDDRAAQTRGLGLGLSIVRRIATLLSLDVALKSRRQDPNVGEQPAGTWVRIHGLNRASPAADGGMPAQPENLLAGLLIWVVDDDPDTLEATAALLQRWGSECVCMERPDPTIDCNADVLICDYELGDRSPLDGLAYIAHCRAQRPQLRALLMTGNTAEELTNQARSADVPVLHKPVAPARFKSMLLSAVAGRQDESS